VIPDASLGARSFLLEVDLTDGNMLSQLQHTQGEPFNWNGLEVKANLQAMADELPMDAQRLDQLCETVLNAQRHDARSLVSACVVAG
jgi:hypothetical protein